MKNDYQFTWNTISSMKNDYQFTWNTISSMKNRDHYKELDRFYEWFQDYPLILNGEWKLDDLAVEIENFGDLKIGNWMTRRSKLKN